jgi:hypothetical protein
MELHSSFDPESTKESIFDVQQRVAKQYTVLKPLEEVRWEAKAYRLLTSRKQTIVYCCSSSNKCIVTHGEDWRWQMYVIERCCPLITIC